MLTITVIAAGKTSERWQDEACDEYIKRLGAFCKFRLIQIKEGESAIPKLPAKAYKIALCVEGVELDSPGLASLIGRTASRGISEIAFVIGGSDGLTEEEKAACDLRLSFSRLTFPHGMIRVFLLEQIYRAFTIIKGLKYHK
ncbi:MAG TPA: 23S rRNA (pseudouridine(1915)-N(3))-methyltransferase RlmH [Bacillota bacterium]|nr:23S rRNA (pseudouridine(1915)-N(3))-methyltransferase RlmH [Clostridiales bacterium]HPT85375.1 23S rRNA (pseudouridine(1915)-N(3))-methyltransferase RlmH [Bacillota bacterium]